MSLVYTILSLFLSDGRLTKIAICISSSHIELELVDRSLSARVASLLKYLGHKARPLGDLSF
jgi:hypothetical protein